MLTSMWRKENTCALLVGMSIGIDTMENSLEFPQKVKNRTTIWSSNSTSGNTSKGRENTMSKRYLHPHVQSSIIYSIQGMEKAKCPLMDEWIKKLWLNCTMEYYSAVEKEENLHLWQSE